MDSYEYYLLFHVDKPAFLKALSDRPGENEQLIEALERLIVNKKEICDEIKELLLSMVLSDNSKVEWILSKLLTSTASLKAWIDQNDLESNPPAYFRIVRLFIEKSTGSNEELKVFRDLVGEIVQYVYREAVTDRPEAIACLRSMMKQQQVSRWIIEEVSQKLDRTDAVSLKNLCYFFDEICKHNCIKNESEIILKYFENSDVSARKQGIFLIKTLIEFKKLSSQDEESFKKFIVVVETLEESQHLIAPTLELIKQFDFTEKYQDIWFVTCRMILKHDSSLVKQWALNFILRTNPPVPFNEKQTLEILEAFNSTSLLDIHESLCGEPLRQFIVRNLSCVFQSLTEINWTSFTFFRVLKIVGENISQIAQSNEKFPETLRLQTEIIPKRIKHLVIRNGVQIEYSKIAKSVVDVIGFNCCTLQIICNVLKIGNKQELLKLCFATAKTKDFIDFLPRTSDYQEILKFSVTASSERCLAEEPEEDGSITIDALLSRAKSSLKSDQHLKISFEAYAKEMVTDEDHNILKWYIEMFLMQHSGAGLLYTLKALQEMVSLPWPEADSLEDFLETMTNAIFCIDDDKGRLLQLLIDVVLRAAAVNLKVPNIDDQLRNSVALVFSKMNPKDKTRVVHHLIESVKSHTVLDEPSALKEYIREILIEQIKETPMLTKEQLTEMQVSYEIELSYCNKSEDDFLTTHKRSLRLRAAILLSEKFSDSYPQIVEDFMEEFAKASYKKPRYFPNAWIHRMKMHYLQAIFFSATLTPRTIEILVWELLNINNQLNVTYLIEILLARHHPSIVDILKDEELVSKMKAPAVKSIFAIAVMQLNQKNDATLLTEAEKYHDLIFPFTMGQNYGVRAYAQAAIAILHRNVSTFSVWKETEFTRRLAKSASIIASSMKFKNAAKFYDALKKDFRYKLKFAEIWTPEVFYYKIPSLTKMPFDEIVTPQDYSSFVGISETFEIAEFNDDPEMSTLTEELVVPVTSQGVTSNLQMKYKYQVPGDDLVNIYPNNFENSGELKKRSSLIVVASLVTRPPNLGGLARTCEIFGVENYVIESLKLVENFEFKAVSKTAEKWLKISEVKPFQLFDFLIGMRRQGYKIVGAEQSENSVSVEKAVIPQKAVLLLGNEKEGIPANLLSLLDLTIEIPQRGVVRSLNVHVSGAVVVWEYFKQHGISN